MTSFYRKFYILTTIFLFVFFNISFSQENSLVNITITPKNPKPGQEVSIELNSYYLNLDISKISWYVDNNLKKEGVGETKTKTNAGSIGQTKEIKAIITNKDGSKIEKAVKIKTVTVSLITEPKSYAPPFYKGKPLLPYEGEVEILALTEITDINGKKISEDNMIFKWFENSILRYSGVGKNTFSTKNIVPVSSTEISVKIYSLDDTLLTEASKAIIYNLPIINIYENSPIYGILYNKTLPEEYLLGEKEEIKLTAEPFFFDNQISNIKHTWKINNIPVEDKENDNELILKRATNISKGSANIIINSKSQKKIYQSSQKTIQIKYEE